MRIGPLTARATAFAAACVAALAVPGSALATYPGFVGRLAISVDGAIATMPASGPASTFGSDLRFLTNGAVAWDSEPAWAPGGGKIAFTREGAESEIWTMNADGSAKTKVADGSSPSWSPDGRKIAYVVSTESGSLVHVANADGSDPTPLLPGRDPDWSPDGEKIAFVTGSGDDFGIYVMDAAGTTATKIATGFQPDWSPDGTRIAFASCILVLGACAAQVTVVDADGGNQTMLTNTSRHSERPTWSPDGTQIAFQRNTRALDWAILVMNADGTGAKTVLGGFDESYRFADWQALSVGLFASPRTITYGRQTALTTRLFWSGSTTNPVVSLFAQPLGGTRAFVRDVTVSGTSGAVTTLAPTKHTTVSADWSGDAAHAAAETSLVVLVRADVRSALTGFFARRGPYRLYRAGRPVVHKGIVRPNHAGKPLDFTAQRLVNGRWRPFASATFRIGSSGSVTASLRAPIGTYRVRNRFEGDKDHLGGSSSWQYAKVVR